MFNPGHVSMSFNYFSTFVLITFRFCAPIRTYSSRSRFFIPTCYIHTKMNTSSTLLGWLDLGKRKSKSPQPNSISAVFIECKINSIVRVYLTYIIRLGIMWPDLFNIYSYIYRQGELQTRTVSWIHKCAESMTGFIGTVQDRLRAYAEAEGRQNNGI